MKITLEFGTHHYFEEYEKTEKFCPNCGNKTVWKELGVGDVYEGCNHICISCDFIFTLPKLRALHSAWALIPEQLRTGKQLIPISKLGG